MFSDQLISEQPFATKLFSAAVKCNRLAQAYMFTQAQAIVSYNFAIELGKYLNCSNKVDDKPCNNCTNCKWINKNAHPEVITVSPADYIPDDKKSKRKDNIISAEQARLLRKHLMSSSKFYRVIIFTGAIEEKLPAESKDALWLDFKNRVIPPNTNQSRELWSATHLTRDSFGIEPSNILLKTIEEPLGQVIFIFITKDQDNMLSTIVSRCQVVPLKPHSRFDIQPEEYIQEISAFLPPENELDAIKTAKRLIEFSKTEQIELDKVIEYVQIIYTKRLTDGVSNNQLSKQLISNIQKIENTKNMLSSYVNPQAALISMLNSLIIR